MPTNLASIEVTEIDVQFVNFKKGLVAYATIIVNNLLRLNSIAVFKNPNGGYRLAYPYKMMGKNKKIYFHNPINREIQVYFEEAVSNYISKLLAEKGIDKLPEKR